MSWTAPRTWTTGELVTSAIMNTHVRDNELWLHDSQSNARVYNSTSQTITTATDTVLGFDTEDADNDTIHDNVTNNSRLTCKTAGTYWIWANISFAANATGARYADIRANGATTLMFDKRASAGAVIETTLTPHRTVVLAVNDYVECLVWQNSGGNLNVVQINPILSMFGMFRIGA